MSLCHYGFIGTALRLTSPGPLKNSASSSGSSVAFWRSKISYMQFTQEELFRKDPKPKMLSAICECNDLPSLFRSVLLEHLAIKLICENCAPTLVPYFTSHSVILLLLAIQTQKCPNESHSMKFCLKCDVLHRCPFRFLSGRP